MLTCGGYSQKGPILQGHPLPDILTRIAFSWAFYSLFVGRFGLWTAVAPRLGCMDANKQTNKQMRSMNRQRTLGSLVPAVP